MSTTLSKPTPTVDFAASAGEPRIVAWIGPCDDALTRSARAICESGCDAISTFPSIEHFLNAPRRLPVSHVLIVQCERIALDAGEVQALRAVVPEARVMRWIGPLVAPSVQLPTRVAATNQTTATQTSPKPSKADEWHDDWVATISWRDTSEVLPHWLASSDERSRDGVTRLPEGNCVVSERGNRGSSELPEWDGECSACAVRPVILVSRWWATADAIFDAVESIGRQHNRAVPVMTWRRNGVSQSDRIQDAIVVWDDTVWTPDRSTQVNGSVCGPGSLHDNDTEVHVWMTGMATPHQVELAMKAGVKAVWNKPTRRESLESIWAMQRSPKF
ncbi:hypothetical protein LOC71_14555 [Rhodopirellula sp. JC740]|uniref:Uncharacterized protein n=1 Tax=Rhodopirellula halodulae TaxID=2894198 RepID=A0ABS8NIV4_9BACT|nr:hypothetical protein [Rhodopirellula sp. JC740]MCC9643503.1 hypothetical protein [Rhodopirellula sp. JC740]